MGFAYNPADCHTAAFIMQDWPDRWPDDLQG